MNQEQRNLAYEGKCRAVLTAGELTAKEAHFLDSILKNIMTFRTRMPSEKQAYWIDAFYEMLPSPIQQDWQARIDRNLDRINREAEEKLRIKNLLIEEKMVEWKLKYKTFNTERFWTWYEAKPDSWKKIHRGKDNAWFNQQRRIEEGYKRLAGSDDEPSTPSGPFLRLYVPPGQADAV